MNNEKFVCGVCGKSHDSIVERNVCEASCLHERKVAEEKKKKLELKEHQNARKEEVDRAYTNYMNLRNEYIKDYGNYYLTLGSNITSDWETWESLWKKISDRYGY